MMGLGENCRAFLYSRLALNEFSLIKNKTQAISRFASNELAQSRTNWQFEPMTHEFSRYIVQIFH